MDPEEPGLGESESSLGSKQPRGRLGSWREEGAGEGHAAEPRFRQLPDVRHGSSDLQQPPHPGAAGIGQCLPTAFRESDSDPGGDHGGKLQRTHRAASSGGCYHRPPS